MDCGCDNSKKKKFSILKGKENLLQLIRGISKDEDIVKTETLPVEEYTQTTTFEENTDVEHNDTLENDIQIKRLEHILDTIERLRYNADNPQKLDLSKKDV